MPALPGLRGGRAWVGVGAGGQGVQGGLGAPGVLSAAAGTGNIHTQLTVVASDGPWEGGAPVSWP